MFLRTNGLFGWIDSNDKRSLALFAGFLVMFHLLGMVVLALPLMLQWPQVAPVLNWRGYGLVVMPLLTLAGATVFGVQYFWQSRIVRRRLRFRYVDAADEPRLCRIAEPLVIASGIAVPFLAVIEDEAMNAFACGVRRSDIVIVVTRGLIEGLDDDELAGVLAHEIAHIRDGDIRLMAAANVCMASMDALFMRRVADRNRLQDCLGLLATVFMPPLFLAIVLLGTLRQISYWLAQAVRLAIASSREFIADAVAVRLTHDPGALISALQRIEGRSSLGATGSYEAMMIDGAADGETASHPRISERIAALVSTTGGLALAARTRRDTRSTGGSGPAAAFGRRAPATAPMGALMHAGHAFSAPERRTVFGLVFRIARSSPNSLVGLPRQFSSGLLAAWVLLFGVINHAALADPREVAAKFDPTALMKMARVVQDQACPLARNGEAQSGRYRLGYSNHCDSVAQATQARLDAAQAQEDAWRETMIARHHCFVSIPLIASGAPDEGYWPLTKSEEGTSAEMYALVAMQDARDFHAGERASDAALKAYVDHRREGLMLLVDYYGPPGVAFAQEGLLRRDQAAVVDRLRERLADPAFRATLSPVDRAEYRLLVDRPADFVPCKAKLGRNLIPPSSPLRDDMAFGRMQ